MVDDDEDVPLSQKRRGRKRASGDVAPVDLPGKKGRPGEPFRVKIYYCKISVGSGE